MPEEKRDTSNDRETWDSWQRCILFLAICQFAISVIWLAVGDLPRAVLFALFALIFLMVHFGLIIAETVERQTFIQEQTLIRTRLHTVAVYETLEELKKFRKQEEPI